MNRERLIPDLIPPTKEEILTMALDWWKSHDEGINMGEWNQVLINHSFPFRLVKVDEELTQQTVGYWDDKKTNHEMLIHKFYDLLTPVLREMGCEHKFFWKLITRSPKDYLSDENGLVKPTVTIDGFYESMMSSLRCAEDLCWLSELDKFIIVLRPYINIDPKTEWRVLVNKEQVSISQYFYNQTFEYENIGEIDSKIRLFTNTTLRNNVKKEKFVADLIVKDEVTLIELNPFGLSDPCLFKSYDKLDGGFLYNGN